MSDLIKRYTGILYEEDINKGKCIEAERESGWNCKAAPQGVEGDAFLHRP